MISKIIKLLCCIFCLVSLLVLLLLMVNSLIYEPPKTKYSNSSPTTKSYQTIIRKKSFTDSLKQNFAKNKTIPMEYQKQILVALSHYPKLKNTEINFRVEKATFPLQSYPNPISLLIPWQKRKYTIVISCKSIKEYEQILLNKIPLDGQIGVIGHELSHVSFYSNQNSCELAWIGLKYYFSSDFRNQFERQTDEETITHGLGFQLLKWREYYEKLPLSKGKDFKGFYFDDRYLSANEIKEILTKKEIQDSK